MSDRYLRGAIADTRRRRSAVCARQCSKMAGMDSLCCPSAPGVDEAMQTQIPYRANGDVLAVATSSQDTYVDRDDC